MPRRSSTSQIVSTTTHEIQRLAPPISIKVIVLSLGWYWSSALANTFSKDILNAFPYPVTLTVVQFAFVVAWALTVSVLARHRAPVFKTFRFQHAGITRPTKAVLLTVAPMALFQLSGHIFSHIATSRIPVTLVHTIKGLSPLFTVAAYRLLFGVQYPMSTYVSLVPLTLGVMLACSVKFDGHLIGILSALAAAIIFVSQNIFSKKLLTNSPTPESEPKKRLDKINLLAYCSGMAFVLTMPLWFYSEGATLLREYALTGVLPIRSEHHVMTMRTLGTLFFWNGTVHFMQNFLAFCILGLVSPVTYSIASLFKRVFVIIVAIIWFGQELAPTQNWGIALTFLGLYLYDRAGDARRRDGTTTPARILPMHSPQGRWPHTDGVGLFFYGAAPPTTGALSTDCGHTGRRRPITGYITPHARSGLALPTVAGPAPGQAQQSLLSAGQIVVDPNHNSIEGWPHEHNAPMGVSPSGEIKKKPVSWSNILLGASLNMFECSSLGQPLEVIKTTMAANRGDTFPSAISRIWSRGGVLGFYQGLIPWAWIEASTKGAVLLFVSSEIEYHARTFGAGPFLAGISGGFVGGLVQAYATVGFCTCMKTVEITRMKQAASGVKPPSTMSVFMDIYRREGIRGINKGVNAVAIRQCTNWASRFGLSRLSEQGLRKLTGKSEETPLTALEKVIASSIGGGLSCWNQPIEVIRIEMQSQTPDPNRPKKLTVGTTLKYIYQQNGIKGLYRGVTPRIGLGVWQTVCMVSFGDMAKEFVANLTGEKVTGGH
ncbi:mitochondrial carrier domain-containing protein [Dipodascopsis tothii]|uniref:mitochondrial carrier domain-containing protein n=1 Tax=Dipodascopsis tothii TaxID=44089 RepID=UPI0034CFA8B7